jgi:uncharacterized alkaline shock family protein YloU
VPTRPTRSAGPGAAPAPDQASVAIRGRSLASRRALTDLVRAATLGSYGVTGFAGGGLVGRVGERLGLPPHGIRIGLGDELTVDLDLTVAHGLPIAEVARQVDSAVRYTIRRALERDVTRLSIHVDGLRAGPFEALPGGAAATAGAGHAEAIGPDDLAASGTDVA